MSQLTNYIQKEMDKGFSQDLITKKLLQVGYSKEEIAESFQSLKRAEPLLVRKAIDTIHLDNKVMWSRLIFPVLAVGIVLVLGYLVYDYSQLPEKISLKISEIQDCSTFVEVAEKDMCYLKLAAQGEIRCDILRNIAFRNACQEKIWETDPCIYQSMIQEITSTCALQSEEDSCKKEEDYVGCKTALAVREDDISMCDNLLDCIVSFAVAKNDGSVCALVQNTGACGSGYYEATGDASYCPLGDLSCGYDTTWSAAEKTAFFEKNNASISDYNEYILSFATDMHQLLVCPYYEPHNPAVVAENGLTSSDICVMGVAYRLGEQEICNEFTETYKKARCIELLDCGKITNTEELCNEIQ